MKTLPAGMQALLDSGATTFAYCWKITRKDGIVQGFTEHDRPLSFDSLTYQASSGFTASRVQQQLGLAVDNLTLQGALSSETLNEDDLASGRYDDAEVELWWVNFTDVAMRLLISKGSIGEVKRAETMFTAEFRSLSHRLGQRTGKTFQRYCSASVGDERCRVNLNHADYRVEGDVTAISGRTLTLSGISSYATRWFEHGLITFTSGQCEGLKFEIKAQPSSTRVELWQEPPLSILVGDEFFITAGCRQDNITCRTKFNNIRNFQGFPFMPGNDTIQKYAVQGEGNMDGGSLGLGK